MKKTSKEMIRLLLIAAILFVALSVITYTSHAFLPASIAEIILLPFYLLLFVVIVAFWGVGPLAKRLNKTAIEEAKEKKQYFYKAAMGTISHASANKNINADKKDARPKNWPRTFLPVM